VAAIALVALDVAHRNSRRLFKIDDDGTEGLAVTRVAQCLGVKHEVPALEWPSLCPAIRAVPTPICTFRLEPADPSRSNRSRTSETSSLTASSSHN
jgi:hypothetical protein